MKPSRKETLGTALAASATPSAADTFAADSAAHRDAGRCGVLVRVSPELRRELKLAAITRDTTVQDLMLEAIATVLSEPANVPKR